MHLPDHFAADWLAAPCLCRWFPQLSETIGHLGPVVLWSTDRTRKHTRELVLRVVGVDAPPHYNHNKAKQVYVWWCDTSEP